MQKNNINLETSEEINSSKNIKLDSNRPIKSIGVMVYPSDLDMEIKSSEKIIWEVAISIMLTETLAFDLFIEKNYPY